jgi:pyrroloquinoline quinone biosynthesis protein D
MQRALGATRRSLERVRRSCDSTGRLGAGNPCRRTRPSCVSALPPLDGASKPHLPRGVRLKYDETRGEWLLLAPERVIKANTVAVEILKRCDGAATLDAIVDDLAAQFKADRGLIENDVHALLGELAAKRMVDL